MAGIAAQRSHPAPHLTFGQFLLDQGVVKASHLMQANGELASADATLAEVLVSQGVLSSDECLRLHALWLDVAHSPTNALRPDPDVLAKIDPHLCLRHSVVPLRIVGHVAHIATSRPQTFDPQAAGLAPLAPNFEIVLAEESDIHNALLAHFKTDLTQLASTRVTETQSCRGWVKSGTKRKRLSVLGGALLILTTVFAPNAVLVALLGWAVLTLMCLCALKLVALVAALWPRHAPPQTSIAGRKRPKVSILVPLFKEPEISGELVNRLSRLTYPRSLLDVVLVLEENDTLTRNAIRSSALPSWIRAIVVPDGQPRTKPRAMNYALDFCRGDYIGIYDAEDLPDPDQIETVVETFQNAPPDLVCLQGALDYYNPDQNWMARCFTVEYATWFRVMLPGMVRLGFTIPLGGTTLFFRRHALEQLGGWDAHNVTEDADLGIRLARHGYRTEMLESTTQEEANSYPLAWIKQRSRWLKGYLVTYLVHMRAPRQLLRDLGWWKFLGFQVHFAGSLSQALLAPALWSFWIIPFGGQHPARELLGADTLAVLFSAFILAEVVNIVTGMIAVSGKAHRHLIAWVPTLHLYFMLNAFAAYKALFELITQPFYWDKTQHGHTLGTNRLSQSAVARRIQLKPGNKCL